VEGVLPLRESCSVHRVLQASCGEGSGKNLFLVNNNTSGETRELKEIECLIIP